MASLVQLGCDTPDGGEFIFNLDLVRMATYNPLAELPATDRNSDTPPDRGPLLQLHWHGDTGKPDTRVRLTGNMAVRMYEFLKGVSVSVPREGLPDAPIATAPDAETRDFDLG